MDSKEAISQYKEWHKEKYGYYPTEKLIETFCRINCIEIRREEVAKVEEVKMKHSKLPWRLEIIDDEPTIVSADKEPLTAGTDDAFIVEACNNYEALETNYHNLLAEHQEICAIAMEQKQEIEKENKLIAKLSTNIGKLLGIMDYYKDLLSPSDIKKFEEVKREVM